MSMPTADLKANFPSIYEAFSVIEGGFYSSEVAPIPEKWFGKMVVIEELLGQLSRGEDSEFNIFTDGERGEIEEMVKRNPELIVADEFLNEFVDGFC